MLEYGVEVLCLIDCKIVLVEEGFVVFFCGVFYICFGGKIYFNMMFFGCVVIGIMLVCVMKEDGVDIWGDGFIYKGNDIEWFYCYGLFVNFCLWIYKLWFDVEFVIELGGCKEMSDWFVVCDFLYCDFVEKVYLIDVNIWGVMYEVKMFEYFDVLFEIVDLIMGVKFWDFLVVIEIEDVSVMFEGGCLVVINGVEYFDLVVLVMEVNMIGGCYGLGMSD